jgi:Family of unknown function (DUF5764)
MDDFVIANLHESRNEWCCRLVSILSPLVAEGLRSIFNEAWKLCVENDEANKYLMTFQNLLSRIPKWNETIIADERQRIVERSGCNYLEDLITCVHIIQLKVLTCIRVGNKQKKIDISIPKLDMFIHKVYINIARKVYSNVYLFDKSVNPLQFQKNGRELELMIQDSIMIAIRESIPTEAIIRAYMDETVEQEEEIIYENLPDQNEGDQPTVNDEEKEVSGLRSEDDLPPTVPTIQNMDDDPVTTQLTFNDIDSVLDGTDQVKKVEAPKNIERLEEISMSRAIQRKLEEQEEDQDEDGGRLKISDSIDLSGFDILDPVDSMNSLSGSSNLVLNDVEELF